MTISSERVYFEERLSRYTQWRRELHAHPEIAFEEERTAAFVSDRLVDFGLEIHRGLAKTGVVGVLKARGALRRRVGLRADLDALPMTEESHDLPHCSLNQGKMHACGHDGHVVMLLAAAEFLSQHPLDHTEVVFIFQPAEENVAGGRVMVEEGLFELFPVDEVFGLHNLPGLAEGCFAAREGAQMASADMFSITLSGQGGHAAWPHRCDDVILASAELIVLLQGLVSRRIDPLESAVLSITQVHGGESDNVLPSQVILRGTVRALDEEVREALEERMEALVNSHAKLRNLELQWVYEKRYAVTVNAAHQTALAINCAKRVVGDDHVDSRPLALMGAEDFGWMLRERPGCYMLLGAGEGPMLHHPKYDFNDRLIPLGASYWVELARG